MRRLLFAALLLLFLLHNDLWWWDEPRLVAGLPIGMTWHVGLCAGAVGVFWLLVKFAWPPELAVGSEE